PSAGAWGDDGASPASDSAIASASSTPVSPMTSSAVLSQNTMSPSAPNDRRSAPGGAAATRSTASSIAAGRPASRGNPLSAAEPRSRWVTTARRSVTALVSGECRSVARPSSTAARVSHASIRKTLRRNCRSPSATRRLPSRDLGGQLEAREARAEGLGHSDHLVHRLARLEHGLLRLDRHARDGLHRDRPALDPAHLLLGRVRDLQRQRRGLPRDLADLVQPLAGLDGDLEAGLHFARTFFHGDDRLLRLGLHRL